MPAYSGYSKVLTCQSTSTAYDTIHIVRAQESEDDGAVMKARCFEGIHSVENFDPKINDD
jgi:hypothetical protein